MKKKIECSYSRTHGGKFEWRCIKEIHDGDDHHAFRPFTITKKPSDKGRELV